MKKRTTVTMRQIKPSQGTKMSWPEFWQILENLPKFKKIGRITQIAYD